MTDLPSTDHARPNQLRRDGACLREGLARSHGRQRNPARMTPRSPLRTPTNRPPHHAQRWVEKVGRSITNSETPRWSAGNYLRALLHGARGNLREAILGYNHSPAYANDVLARARGYAGEASGLLSASAEAADDTCTRGGIDAPAGPADVRTAHRVASPHAFTSLPAWAMAGDRAPQAVDARLYDDVIWILRRYQLRVTAAREAGHHTHGDGTALDLVPAEPVDQAAWDASAGALARDLGWTPRCGTSGTRPACPLVPAIQFVGYDGYRNHGSPRTCSGACPAHLHISWVSPCYGTSAPSAPCSWVMAFAAETGATSR